ncbi:MAG: thioredoxin family protein [Opitutales bacterium]
MKHLLALLLAPVAALASEGWLTDLDAAKKQAAAEKKDILIDFTGSDWCGWCIKLDKEVFSTSEFKAQKQFVLVSLDFPRKKQIPAEAKAKNEALMKKWGVQGFPTIILANAAGEAYAETGYQEGGPVKYLAHLTELRKQNTPEGVKAFVEKGNKAAEESARRAAVGAKMKALVEANDFDGACKLIDENFPAARKESAALAAFNKAMLSMRMDPTNKTRALKFADTAVAEAEKLGNEPMINAFKKARDEMSKDSDVAAKAGK